MKIENLSIDQRVWVKLQFGHVFEAVIVALDKIISRDPKIKIRAVIDQFGSGICSYSGPDLKRISIIAEGIEHIIFSDKRKIRFGVDFGKANKLMNILAKNYILLYIDKNSQTLVSCAPTDKRCIVTYETNVCLNVLPVKKLMEKMLDSKDEGQWYIKHGKKK